MFKATITVVLLGTSSAPCGAAQNATARTRQAFQRNKEFTYTITSVLQIAKPYRLSDMTDDYQEARLLSEDRDSITVEIVYYPLNTNSETIGENPNWRRDYARMTAYLRPTPTEHWDEKMGVDLIAELKRGG